MIRCWGSSPLRPLRWALLPVLAGAGPSVGSDFSTILAEQLGGWHRKGPVATYDPDELYQWIDGAAEVYRALNVQRAASGTYRHPALAVETLVDVFDMGSPQDAYGAFHHDPRPGPAGGFGQESEIDGSNAAFWQGRYFVSVVGLRPGDEVSEGVRDLAGAVADRIPDRGDPPALVARLPERGLVRSQIHYFHDPLLLGTHVRVGPDNPLALSGETEGLVARYRDPATDESAVLLLVRYPAGTDPQETLDRFLSLGPGRVGAVQGRMLAATVRASDPEWARDLVESALGRFEP